MPDALSAPNPLRRLAVLALRLLRRDLASGRLSVMLLASVVAVAATVSVNLLVARVGEVLLAESSALLAADLAIASNELPPERYLEHASERGLRTSRTASMRSVIAHGDALQLVRLKIVDAHYPLRGRLLTSESVFAPATESPRGPPRGEVWGDAKMHQLLDVRPGDTVTIGASTFRLGRVLVLEPDRGGDLFSIAPRVMMNYDDLAGTGLVIAGSRLNYTTLVAGDADAIADYRRTLNPETGDQILDPREARPEVSSAFGQAERFLALAAFAGVLLATIGIALAASGYSEHHEPTTAIVKTLGLAPREVTTIFLIELVCLALLATLFGNLIAVASHGALIDRFIPAAASAGVGLPVLPLAHGGLVALTALVGFGLPTLARLARVPVIAILARDRVSAERPALLTAASMLAAILIIAPWHVGQPGLVALTLLGMLGCALTLALTSFALVFLMGRLRQRTSMSWRFGLANIARRARLSVLQSTAVGLGIAVILLLSLVRNDLARQWSDRLPPDAPNHFLINVQDDEVDSMLDFLNTAGVGVSRFYPMVRGRLTAINGRNVTPDDYPEPRARRLADREFNLSWATTMKPDNRLVAGRWWSSANARGELSVERGIAERLGFELGDELTFTIAGTPVSGTVTSLRAVEWDNFQVNFFVVTTPELLVDQPATFITAFRLPEGRQAVMRELVARYPSVTVIDVDALMRQVRSVMDRVSAALLWVFMFALTAGLLVLAAAAQASQRERVLDTVLLKTLGASRRFIRTTMLMEFALLGVLAGAVASLGAIGTGWLLAHGILDIPYRPSLLVPLFGILGGSAGVSLVGLTVLRRALGRPVTDGLRETL